MGDLAFLATLPVTLAACGAESPAADPAPAHTTDAAPSPVVARAGNRILAFGDSLFAGYGLAQPSQAYPAKLEAALRTKGYDVLIANAGVSGDTTAAGRQRFAFTLDSQPVPPTLVLLELGGNDLLRGLPPEQTRANLAAMLDELKARDIPVALYSLQAPPNYGPRWQAQFDAIYGSLAREYGVPIVPFVTEAVFADPRLLQRDRVHPTAQGVEKLVAATLPAVEKALPPTASAPAR